MKEEIITIEGLSAGEVEAKYHLWRADHPQYIIAEVLRDDGFGFGEPCCVRVKYLKPEIYAVSVIDKIGPAAALEQLGEECAELIQVCSKLSRNIRGENPSRKTDNELVDDLTEEIADVILCMDRIKEFYHIDEEKIKKIVIDKDNRAKEHLGL